MTVSEWGERFLTSRIDIDVNTRKNYGSALKKIGETFGDRDPGTITASESPSGSRSSPRPGSREP